MNKFEKNSLGHNKRFNLKKLKNMLRRAINKGLPQVTIYNHKKGTERTISTFELEQYINEHNKSNSVIKHPLSSTLPKDIIPWYKDVVELELVYKNQLDEKFTTSAQYSPITDPTLKLIGDSVEEQIKYTNVTYNISTIDEQQHQHTIQYNLHVQKFPANVVFAYSPVDVYAYNLSYLYIAERKHDGSSNSNIVDFVTYIAGEPGFKTLYSDKEEKNYETGLKHKNDSENVSVSLSYITIGDSPLTLKYNTYQSADRANETWEFPNTGLYIQSKNVSVEKTQDSTHNMKTPHTKFGIIYNGTEKTSYEINVLPYTLAWIYNDAYKECITYSSFLTDSITVNVHPVNVELSFIGETDISDSDTDATEETDIPDSDTGTTEETNIPDIVTGSTNIESIYLSKNVSIDLTKNIKYNYNIDNTTDYEEYDLTKNLNSEKYTCTLENGNIIELPILYTDCTVNGKTFNPTYTYRSRVDLTFDNKFLGDFQINTKTYLINPLNFEGCSGYVNLNNNVSVVSNPTLKSGSNTQKTIVKDLHADYDNESSLTIGGTFTYNVYVDNVSYIKDQENNTYVVNNGTLESGNPVNSFVLESVVYSFGIKNSGFVDEINEENSHVFTYEGDLTYEGEGFNEEEETQTMPLKFKYTYIQSEDRTKLTRPEVNVISVPTYETFYIGNKAITYITSDDFNITAQETDTKPFNNYLISGILDTSKYIVKNSYLLCELPADINNELSEPVVNGSSNLVLSYQHKSNIGSTEESLSINLSNNYESRFINVGQTAYLYEIDNETYAYSQWNIEYNVYNAYNHNGNSNDNCIDSEIIEYTSFVLNNPTPQNNEGIKTQVELKIKDSYSDVGKLINKIIPDEIFAALYTKMNTGTMKEGFNRLDTTIQFNVGNVVVDAYYQLTPVFVSDNNDENIHLDTITDVFMKSNESMSVWSMYYLCKNHDNDNDYYLCCIFTEPGNTPGNHTDTVNGDCTQILPPLLYHLNMYNIESDENNMNYVSIADYEIFTNENDNPIKKDIKYPKSNYTTYMLYGFNENVLNLIGSNTNVQTDIESIYKNISEDNWVLKSSEMTYCKMSFEYNIDDNGKLGKFHRNFTEPAYTYVNEYYGKLDYKLDNNVEEEPGYYPYNLVMDDENTPQEITFSSNIQLTGYYPVGTSINTLYAYTSILYIDNEHDFSYWFKFHKNDKNIACNDNLYTFGPKVISDYECVNKPDSEYPKYGLFVPEYELI